MKKNIYLASLLCGFIAFSTTSCDDPGEPQFEIDEFTSTLYIKDSGLTELDFYNVNKDITFTTAIGKGGTDAEVARTATLRIFTQEELDTYNKQNGSEYVTMPTDCYEFNKEYTFEAQMESQELAVTLKAKVGELDPDIQYVLPIKLTSPIYSVNEKKKALILKPTIITPTVSLTSIGKQSPMGVHSENTYLSTATFSTKVKLDMPNSGWEFSAQFEKDQDILHFFVDQYSVTTGKIYKLLPATAYSLPDMDFANTENEKALDIEVSYKPGMTAGDYLLPIVLKGVSGMPFDVDTNPCYIHINVTDGIMKIAIVPTDISGNNSQETDYRNLVDGTTNSVGENWQSIWAINKKVEPQSISDPTYGVYIDIENLSKKITKVLKIKMTTTTGHNYPKNFTIYGQTEGSSDWTNLENVTDGFTDNKKVWEKEISVSEEIIAIRVALTQSKSGNLREIKFGNESGGWYYYNPNVGLNEIELFGY